MSVEPFRSKTELHVRLVTGWLNDLARLTAPQLAVDDLASLLPPLAAALASDFTADAAFCRESVLHVGRECRSGFFPPYGAVYAALGAWWKENRPRPVALPPPAVAPLEPPDEASRERAHRLVQEVTADLRRAADAKATAARPAPISGEARTDHLSDG